MSILWIIFANHIVPEALAGEQPWQVHVNALLESSTTAIIHSNSIIALPVFIFLVWRYIAVRNPVRIAYPHCESLQILYISFRTSCNGLDMLDHPVKIFILPPLDDTFSEGDCVPKLKDKKPWRILHLLLPPFEEVKWCHRRRYNGLWIRTAVLAIC